MRKLGAGKSSILYKNDPPPEILYSQIINTEIWSTLVGYSFTQEIRSQYMPCPQTYTDPTYKTCTDRILCMLRDKISTCYSYTISFYFVIFPSKFHHHTWIGPLFLQNVSTDTQHRRSGIYISASR